MLQVTRVHHDALPCKTPMCRSCWMVLLTLTQEVSEHTAAAAPWFLAAPGEQQAWTKGFKGEGSALLHLQTTASPCVGVCPSCCCPGAPMSERLSCLGGLPWVGSTDTSLGFPQRPHPSPSCCLDTLRLVGRACWASSGNSRFGAALAPC